MMKRFAQGVATLTMLLLLGGVAFAEDKAEKTDKAEKKSKGEQKQARVIGFQLPKSIELTDEQQKQVAAYREEYAPKLQEVTQQINGIYTREQKQARRQAMQQARQDGMKGAALRKHVEAAFTPTDEQKKELEPLMAKQKELQAELKEKILSVLTDEQKAKLPQPKSASPKKKKKKDAA